MTSNVGAKDIIPKWEVIWVNAIEQLNSVVQDSLKEEYITIDTETIGWQTGNEKLALAQIGIPSQKKAYLIDVLNIESIDQLKEFLVPTKPAKVAHNASFEDRQFGSFGIKMKGIRDTLTMARNLRPDLPNHQLKTCCRYVLGVDMSKAEQASDWGIRPLSASQLQYAALDVELLDGLYVALRELEEKLIVPADRNVEQLMQELYGIIEERFDLLKDIAPKLSYLDQRHEKIKDAIKDRLINGEPPYKGEFGEASVKLITQREVNTQKVKELFPEIVPLVVAEKVERKRLLDVMQEHGIDKARLDEVLDPSNSYYRLNLEVEG